MISSRSRRKKGHAKLFSPGAAKPIKMFSLQTNPMHTGPGIHCNPGGGGGVQACFPTPPPCWALGARPTKVTSHEHTKHHKCTVPPPPTEGAHLLVQGPFRCIYRVFESFLMVLGGFWLLAATSTKFWKVAVTAANTGNCISQSRLFSLNLNA